MINDNYDYYSDDDELDEDLEELDEDYDYLSDPYLHPELAWQLHFERGVQRGEEFIAQHGGHMELALTALKQQTAAIRQHLAFRKMLQNISPVIQCGQEFMTTDLEGEDDVN